MKCQSDVTVVIPTTGRDALKVALDSVRRQDHANVTTIVVLDDPGAEVPVRAMLEGETLIVTAGRTGAASARNVGLEHAQSRYVAFLDDDDWWEPTKLRDQLDTVRDVPSAVSFSSTYFHEEHGNVRLLPRRTRRPNESIADYLVLRPRLKHGEGYIQTSSLLAETDLLKRVKWDPALPKHQDWDLIARLDASGAEFVFVDKPLVHVQQGSAGSISRSSDWRASLDWADRHGANLSPRAKADFVATHVLRAAAAKRDGAGIAAAFRRMWRTPPHAAAFIVGIHGLVEGRSRR